MGGGEGQALHVSVAGSGESQAFHIAVVGAGGNIGSHLVPHLGHLARELRSRSQESTARFRVTLIDPDHYEPSNLFGQAITDRDLGRNKAKVQARRLKAIVPFMEVEAHAAAVETLPRGLLRADLILSCLDSRAARQWVNEIAVFLGCTWIDAGVEASGLLARVTVFPKGPDRCCLECGWDQRHYDTLEQLYSCGGSRLEAAATRAPSSLGALAASLQVLECRRILLGELPSSEADAAGSARERLGAAPSSEPDAAGRARERLVDVRGGQIRESLLERNPRCRLGCHEAREITALPLGPGELTLRELFALGEDEGVRGMRELVVEGASFRSVISCDECGRNEPALGLLRPPFEPPPACPSCGAARSETSVAATGHLSEVRTPAGSLALPAAAIGLRGGDVFTLRGAGQQRHFQLAMGSRRSASPKEDGR